MRSDRHGPCMIVPIHILTRLSFIRRTSPSDLKLRSLIEKNCTHGKRPRTHASTYKLGWRADSAESPVPNFSGGLELLKVSGRFAVTAKTLRPSYLARINPSPMHTTPMTAAYTNSEVITQPRSAPFPRTSGPRRALEATQGLARACMPE